MKKIVIMGLCVCAVHYMSMAQDGNSAGVFKSKLSMGVTLTDGNSDTMQANGSLITEGEKDGLGSVRAGIEAAYGESKVDGSRGTTVENARLFANVKKTISTRMFASLDGTVVYDDIARIDYRVTVAPGLGIYLVKNDRSSFFIEAGPAYVWEKVAGVSDDQLALRFAERFEYAFSKTSRVWQSLVFVPVADDFDDYLLNAEIGAEAALNAHLNLRVVLQDKYDSTPGEGLEKNDLVLIAGISLSL